MTMNLTMDNVEPLREAGLVYLASPYTKFPGGLERATRSVATIAGRLMQRGISVFSPIVHTHYIAEYTGLDPIDHDFWMDADRIFMDKCDSLVVAQMSGWEESRGVRAEIDYFRLVRKPMFMLNPGRFE